MSEKEKPAVKDSEPKKSPAAWAQELGHFKRYGRKGAPESAVLPSAAYASAEVLYGWAHQAHHWGADSFQISRKDFEAALEASAKFPTVRPHKPAIPKVSEDKFADFIPLKAHKD